LQRPSPAPERPVPWTAGRFVYYLPFIGILIDDGSDLRRPESVYRQEHPYRGTSAVSVIRDAVAEIEAARARQLGPKCFTTSATSYSGSSVRPNAERESSRHRRSRTAKQASPQA
jgi:hypothetical protein